MSDKEMNQNKTISYHTFLFPFLWNGNEKSDRKSFIKCLHENWVEENYTDDDLSTEQKDEKYNQYHYFNAAARNAIYPEAKDNAVIKNYSFNLFPKDRSWLKSSKSADNKARYVIKKGEMEISLPLNGIRLKLFNTGIGIMIFELENYEYEDEETIKWINDFGRRIYMPYSNDGYCYSCADEIVLKFADKEITSGSISGIPISSFRRTHLATPITYLLTNNEYSVTTDEGEAKRKKNLFYIEPVIDDRMFVACYYINKKLTEDITEWNEGEYLYISDAESKKPDATNSNARRLYEIMFVDGDGMTCYSRNTLKYLLRKHIYDRWVEKGSVTGITEYSFITVTSVGTPHLINAFLTDYIEMVTLVLAQRATLLNFERMISDSALGKKDIREIQKNYILFQSQLLLKEVTPQQQGIELYNMLLDNLFISEQTAEIEKQIDGLFVQKTAINESRENLILFMLAALGIFEVVDILTTWICSGTSDYVKLGISLAVTIVLGFAYYKNRKK